MKLIWVALLAVACGSCNRPTYSYCLGGKGRIDARHPVEIRGAMMMFIKSNAWVEDVGNHGLYKVAEFKPQPRSLWRKMDTEAARWGFSGYKSTVSLEGYEFTCVRCGDHFIVVNKMTASEPTEITNQDLQAEEGRLKPALRNRPTAPECEILPT